MNLLLHIWSLTWNLTMMVSRRNLLWGGWFSNSMFNLRGVMTMCFYFFSVIPLLFLFFLNLQYFKLQNPSTETSFVWGVTHQLKKIQRIDDLQRSERSLWALNKKTQVGCVLFWDYTTQYPVWYGIVVKTHGCLDCLGTILLSRDYVYIMFIFIYIYMHLN